MRAFTELLDQLVFTPQRSVKLRLIASYMEERPDPERGWALAALAGTLDLAAAKPAMIRDLVAERTDPVLFALSYDYVGDLAETASLIWPEAAAPSGRTTPLSLEEVVHALNAAPRREVPGLLADWLDTLDRTERWALLKLVTGGLRIGVSARLTKTALAECFDRPLAVIEEVWHALDPPYPELFAWLEGRGPRPNVEGGHGFRPPMLANPLEEEDVAALPAGEFAAEWKWDGIRVQCVARGGERRLYSRTGDDIGRAFPDVIERMDFDAVLDGELLTHHPDQPPPGAEVAPFNGLQQRLNRKTVTSVLLRRQPAFVRLYDILFDGDEDLRPLPFRERRHRLEAWYARAPRPGLDLSSLVPFAGFDEFAAIRAGARTEGIEGLMLKRWDSPYVSGRPRGPWFKWKRAPLTLDVVLMYAQRGHGRRSSFYSDYTFGTWRPAEGGGEELVPVGKAYFGFTDEELGQLDRWVRNHTTQRFGPVREVEPGLVFEVAFDSVHRSTRHKSGVAMRFPRIARIRWDKPPGEADHLETLERLIVGQPSRPAITPPAPPRR